MHDKTLEELAYFRIRDQIASFCASEESYEVFIHKKPLTDFNQIESLKSLGREWSTILNDGNYATIQSWLPIHRCLKLCQAEGASLELEQLFAIYGFCNAVISASNSINSASKSLQVKNLLALSEKLPVQAVNQALNELTRVINKDGSLKDLPIIREIRAKIASIRAEIDAALKKYTSDTTLASALASNVPALKGDRQLIAVKANQRNRINGIVHEVSASGQTMYIEPEEAVRKNNELIQEEFHLQSEMRKIFTDLTAKIAPFALELKEALLIMEQLDQTCAAAKWARQYDCIFIDSCKDDEPPALINARHPLLGAEAVPITMEFFKGKRVLIITGANTGGKTVAIKTFALLAMLNQSGFAVPCGDGSRLPVFNSIFADIGDEQSIDQSLSTFSAHIKNIAAACRHADSKSLVLLDELGSGTDPQEGSAISMAVLNELIERKAFTLVTTHQGVLKNFGYTNEFCTNASVDFDDTSLRPTYRLLMGIPGKSHALDIAKRSGLPSDIIKKAQAFITNNQTDVSTLIQGLTQKHNEVLELEKSARSREALLAEKELKFQQKLIRLREKEIELEERQKRESADFVSSTRKELENLVRTLREGEITREKTLGVKSFIQNMQDNLAQEELSLEQKKNDLDAQKEAFEKEMSFRSENGILISKDNSKHGSSKKKTKKKLSTKEAFANAKVSYTEEEAALLYAKSNSTMAVGVKNTAKPPKLEFVPGAAVIHVSTKTKGTLIEKSGRNAWQVQLGSMRMTVKEKDLVLTYEGQPLTTVSVEMADTDGLKSRPEFELRLLGQREEEAIRALERQLALCRMNNFKTFSIIHGKGNGILQQAVWDYLGEYPGVKKFYFARPEDGGSGKTYVELN